MPTNTKTPLFLFRLNLSSNHIGNYFDGEDPYRQYDIRYYTFGANGKAQFAGSVWLQDERFCTSTAAQNADDEVLNKYAKRHPGHKIIVLSIDSRSPETPIETLMNKAIHNYMKFHRVHRIVPAYIG